MPGGRVRSLGYLVLTRAGGRPCQNAGRIPVGGSACSIFPGFTLFNLIPQTPGVRIRALAGRQ